jgi:signal transduction histidine kinase
VKRTLARTLSISIVVLAFISVTIASVIFISNQNQVPPSKIVVVGDPAAPRMQEVLGELERAVEQGDDLDSTDGEFWVLTVLLVLFLVLWLGTGILIVWRRAANWAGWLFLFTAVPLPLLALTQALMVYGLKIDPGSVPLIGVWATIGEYALYPFALIPLFFLLYPDGHLPSRGWRWAVAAVVGGAALAILGFLFRPGPFNNWVTDGILYENPLAIAGYTWGGTLISIGTLVALAGSLSTPVAVVQRFRRSAGEERQQMRVLALVAGIAGGFFALLGIPVAYLVAIFRYRLWELDVVVKKTVVFAVVAGAITLVAVLVLLALPVGVFGTGLSGWERGLLLVGVVVGLLIGPLRRRARRVADRIVYGKRATPYEVLTAFSERVGDTYATEDVLPRMARLLVEGTGATQARVLVRVGSELVEEGRWPDQDLPRAEEHAEPVVDQGDELGALAVSMPPNDPMDPAKEKLIRDLASQAGLLLRNVKLIEELRASRQRLVAAQDEERRKIERNLHDGAQQQLVALAVRLRLAGQMVERDPAKAREILEQLQAGTNEALEDLRDLARGIYPPLLADKGLPAALDAQARKSAVPVTLEPNGVGRYPQEIEATIYFCVLEAMQNISKYARATAVWVALWERDDHLGFEVRDDGIGFDPGSAPPGTGLQGMADRLDAVRGELRVSSEPGRGTTIAGAISLSGNAKSDDPTLGD